MATSMKADARKEKPNTPTQQPNAGNDLDLSNSDKKSRLQNKSGRPSAISKDEDEAEKIQASVDKGNLPPASLFQLYRFNTKFEIFLNIVGLFCAICSGAAQPLMTLMFGNLALAFVNFGKAIQGALQSDNATTSAHLKDAANAFKKTAAQDATYLVYIGVGMFVTTYTFMVIWNQNAELAAKRMRERYLQSILRQDIAFFDNVGAGEVATRIQNDTGLVQLGISEKVPLVLSLISTFFTGYIIAFIRSWKLALACASILPFIVIAGGIMSFFLTKLKMAQINHVALAGTIAEEVISTIRTAQAFGAQSSLERLYDKYINEMHALDSKIAITHSGGVSVFFFVNYAAYALAFSFGATLVLRGEGNIGVVLNVLTAITMGSMSLAMLAPEAVAIFHARAAAAKLFDTIDRIPPIDSASVDGLKPDPSTIEGEITFHEVGFNYPSRPDVPVLQGVDLSFPAGKRVALVGASGSGKSTVIALVERFYDPLSGSVHLDGTDIRDLNVKWLRSQIGLVSQEPVLFSTTIRANVEHGLIGTNAEHLSEEEKMARIREACIKANADGFINALPDGYDTLVGERGFLLSGGQKQRVAIARAIVSDPKVLLLDEATSALDTQSEGVVQNALDKASVGRTTIIVAHRLSTIRDVERIYVMGDGSVLEMGTHNELLQNSEGPYARLVRAQKLKGADQVEELPRFDTQEPIEGSGIMVENERGELDEKKIARVDTSKSLTSEIVKHRGLKKISDKEEEFGIFYIMGRMAKINRESWKFYVIGFSAALVTGMTYPVFGIIYGRLIQDFQYTGHELRVQADRGSLWIFIIGILACISYAFQDISFQRTAGDLSYRIRTLAFRSILRHDISYFDEDEHSTGSLTSGLSQNPERIAGLAGVTLGAITQSLVTVVGGSIIGLCYGWKLALVGIACIPFVISTGYVRLRIVVMKDKKNRKNHEESAQIACEAAGAIRTVASLTREEDCVRLYSESLEKPLRIAYRSAFNSTIYFSLSQSMVFFVIALVFWYGSRLVASLEYSTVDFFVCLMSVTFGAVQAGSVFNFVPDISQSHMAGTEVVKLLDYHPEIDSESAEGRTISDVEGRIELKHVHFRYPTRLDVRVLRDFSLTVEPGTHVALVGPSGCGKSTVIQLVERFYNPISGSILIDGNKIDEINVQEYRKHLALVSQEPTLYAGTIKFNVLLGATKPLEEVTQEEIEAACKDANILDFIQSLPDGFETQVGGKGSQLSGGQKQRIAIARALLRNPSVLLLDEATSALDSNSEHIVQDALDSAAKGRTTISIAHRLSTIQKCDLIHFMSEGRIVESGTHDELLQRRGKYYEYVLLQDLSGQRAV